MYSEFVVLLLQTVENAEVDVEAAIQIHLAQSQCCSHSWSLLSVLFPIAADLEPEVEDGISNDVKDALVAPAALAADELCCCPMLLLKCLFLMSSPSYKSKHTLLNLWCCVNLLRTAK